jgi:hypothetical protein
VTTFLKRAELSAWIGLGGIFVGASELLVYAWVEFLNKPGISLVDAYWIGREPWSSAGIIVALAGSVLAILAGAAVVLLRGDWVRWLLLLPLLAASVLWWAIALGFVAYAGFAGPDPVGLAHGEPQTAAILLVVPPLAIAALAFLPMQPDRRIRRRRVHPRGTPPPPRDEG